MTDAELPTKCSNFEKKYISELRTENFQNILNERDATDAKINFEKCLHWKGRIEAEFHLFKSRFHQFHLA